MDVIVRLVNSDYDLTLFKNRSSIKEDNVVVEKVTYIFERIDLHEDINYYFESEDLCDVEEKFLVNALRILGKSF